MQAAPHLVVRLCVCGRGVHPHGADEKGAIAEKDLTNGGRCCLVSPSATGSDPRL